jgi:glycosyltransferase involved in cell wall biosynthesis
VNAAGQRICLSMIVKDEAHVIRRCLESVRPFIDAWVVVDTGSCDGTQELVRAALADLPGELVERPWVDFAHNRNQALELARPRADYLLFIDADETLEAGEGFAMPGLEADAYDLEVHYGGLAYTRRQLVRAALPWRFVGVLHEHLECGAAGPARLLAGLRTVPRHTGARARDRDTYRRDAEILARALEAEPDNGRYAFYLAQSWRDAGEPEKAVAAYRRRIAMGGWPDEVC